MFVCGHESLGLDGLICSSSLRRSYMEIDNVGARRYDVAMVYLNFSENSYKPWSGAYAIASASRIKSVIATSVQVGFGHRQRFTRVHIDSWPNGAVVSRSGKGSMPTAVVSYETKCVVRTSEVRGNRSILKHRFGHSTCQCQCQVKL